MSATIGIVPRETVVGKDFVYNEQRQIGEMLW